MTTHTFKILTYNDKLVDGGLLSAGIYPASVPILYSKNITIEDLKNEMLEMSSYLSEDTITNYIKNLEKCEFKIIELTFEDFI